jgi:CDP-glucose 4,6-dehydratase
MISEFKYLKKFWKNKKVFLTGHTGFKGSWMSIFFNLLGTKVIGYSLKPNDKINLFDLAEIKKINYRSIIGDIRDYNKLKTSIKKFKPDFIIHMAAQSLVRNSYLNAKYTYEVNTLGTLNILNIIKELNFIKSALIITTDKVYENKDILSFYKENDPLGGFDPYSSSKACAELIYNSYNISFLKKKKIFVATARAGNIIGGGDFSNDRILPDYFRSFKNGKIYLRSPNSIRPWQHVIDPLYGYLKLLYNLYVKKENSVGSWNFGPSSYNNKSVLEIVKIINSEFKDKIKIIKKPILSKIYHESSILMLNSSKAKKFLNWKARYDINTSLKLTADWYKKFKKKENVLKICQEQLLNYFNNKII